MSEFGEDIIENLEENFGSCSLDHENKISPNYKVKTFYVGEGNIIGKSVIQEFFNCTGTMPIGKRSILLDTNCYDDAIALLVENLE